MPNPNEPEPNRFEGPKNSKSEYRNPKKIEIQMFKKANKEKPFEFETFGFISNFGFRASDLKSAVFTISFDAILRTT